MSIRWWTMRLRRPRSGLALPMSSPRYTNAESTLTISRGTGVDSARRTAHSLLPDPVGPVSTSTGGFGLMVGTPTGPSAGAEASPAPQEQLVQLREREPRPGGPPVIALVGAIGQLHLAQQ